MVVISVVLTLGLVSACYFPGPCLQGYGPVINDIRYISGFTEVTNTGKFEVRVSHADTFHVEVEAQENLQSIIETYVSGTSLKIKTRNGTCFNSNTPVIVYVSMPLLEGIRNTGSGELIADLADCVEFDCDNTGSGLLVLDSLFADAAYVKNSGSGDIYLNVSEVELLELNQTGSGYIEAGEVFGTHEFDVEQSSSGRIYAGLVDGELVSADLTGSGRIEIVGEAETADYRLTSSGKIDALELVVADVNARISGSGKIYLYATDNLDVTITGSGDVIYMGNPSISVNITGSGELKKYRN